jgi:hypothetical protein
VVGIFATDDCPSRLGEFNSPLQWHMNSRVGAYCTRPAGWRNRTCLRQAQAPTFDRLRHRPRRACVHPSCIPTLKRWYVYRKPPTPASFHPEGVVPLSFYWIAINMSPPRPIGRHLINRKIYLMVCVSNHAHYILSR